MLACATMLFLKVRENGIEQHAWYCKMAADSIAENEGNNLFDEATAAWKKFQIEDGCLP